MTIMPKKKQKKFTFKKFRANTTNKIITIAIWILILWGIVTGILLTKSNSPILENWSTISSISSNLSNKSADAKGIRKHIPQDANQIIYVWINKYTREAVLQQQQPQLEWQLDALVRNVDKVIVWQNNRKDQIFSFLVGQLKPEWNIQEIQKVFEANKQPWFWFTAIGDNLFAYSEQNLLNKIKSSSIKKEKNNLPDKDKTSKDSG